ncbi:hypothetical protein CC1G_03991 [Coprinopsis cinerea okayama7|uniref:Uncharacterized protein n=1 Tax=Coprinopsis cinerea (strain Okayama-7 / 130 / ATCC MYA-4618 / FGSC 9003) TaxID=240176 RepID=A8N8E4_COPC7|nr:hypothetical protein CC1G_03991 [Coprinopsis cinerea okayama7\|eukprot:XP_001831100.1 hypothetical protein CC1G_03991 [Coprinopsis cinerea okayama7\
MDQCPPEIWIRIFSLACTDDGTTGRSLSLVSGAFNTLSKPFKYQSIALTRSKRVLSFNAQLDRLPSDDRRVKYLFVHCPHVFLDNDDDGDDDYEGSSSSGSGSTGSYDDSAYQSDYQASSPRLLSELNDLATEAHEARQNREDEDFDMADSTSSVAFREQLSQADDIVSKSLFDLLQKISPTLELLSLYYVSCQGRLIEEMIPPLPHLRELCLFRRFSDELAIEPETEDRASMLFPVLERLHLSGYLEERPTRIGETVADLAPSLRVLRIPKHSYNPIHLPPQPIRFGPLIEVVILEPPPINSQFPNESFLPTNITQESLSMTADDPMGLADPRVRVVMMHPSPHEDRYHPEVWKRDWLRRVEGGEGCWTVA